MRVAMKPRRTAAITILVLGMFAGRASAQWTNSGTNIYNTNSGFVGIGTTAPGAPLDVQGNVSTGNAVAQNVRNLISSATAASFFSFGSIVENDTTYSGTAVSDVAGAIFTTRWRGTGSTGPLGLKAISAVEMNAFNYNTGTTEWLAGGRFDIRNISTGTITNMAGFRVSAPTISGGSVTNWYGLYMDNPGSPATNTYSIYAAGGNAYFGANLTVAGNVSVSGNIAAKYQDVAEWVPSTEDLPAGTVVALDPERINYVLASGVAYDTSVAGVVSDKPGVILGEGGNGKVKVATTGRVKVKVDAARLPIRVGDILVASGQPGVAMRSEPVEVAGVRMHRPGTIIGKALEPLASGNGEILVLLTLQ